jgi:hypothetical protein
MMAKRKQSELLGVLGHRFSDRDRYEVSVPLSRHKGVIIFKFKCTIDGLKENLVHSAKSIIQNRLKPGLRDEFAPFEYTALGERDRGRRRGEYPPAIDTESCAWAKSILNELMFEAFEPPLIEPPSSAYRRAQ